VLRRMEKRRPRLGDRGVRDKQGVEGEIGAGGYPTRWRGGGPEEDGIGSSAGGSLQRNPGTEKKKLQQENLRRLSEEMSTRGKLVYYKWSHSKGRRQSSLLGRGGVFRKERKKRNTTTMVGSQYYFAGNWQKKEKTQGSSRKRGGGRRLKRPHSPTSQS